MTERAKLCAIAISVLAAGGGFRNSDRAATFHNPFSDSRDYATCNLATQNWSDAVSHCRYEDYSDRWPSTGPARIGGLFAHQPSEFMAFETLFPFTRLQALGFLRQSTETTAPFATTLERPGPVYDEEAFDHFLQLEKQRATMTGRSCFLLLVGLRPHSTLNGQGMSRSLASGIFGGLEACVREVDVVGWYRQGKLVGAVLPQGTDAFSPLAAASVSARVRRALNQTLSPGLANQLRVRLVRLGRQIEL